MTGGANGTRDVRHPDRRHGLPVDKVGLASAMAVVLLLIVLLITWLQRRLVPDEKVDLS